MSEQLQKYQYATVMQARNTGADIAAGDIHVIDGKKDDGHKDMLFNDDKEVVAIVWDRLKLIDLPERMDSKEIMDFLNENFDEYLADVSPGDSDGE